MAARPSHITSTCYRALAPSAFLIPLPEPLQSPSFPSLPQISLSYLTQPFWLSSLLALLPLPVPSLLFSLLFLSLTQPPQGPVYSVGHSQSGLFQVSLAALSLLSIVKTVSSAIPWYGRALILTQKEWMDCP